MHYTFRQFGQQTGDFDGCPFKQDEMFHSISYCCLRCLWVQASYENLSLTQSSCFSKKSMKNILSPEKKVTFYILHYDTDYLYKRPLNYPLMTSFNTGPTHHRSMINIFDFTRFCSYKAQLPDQSSGVLCDSLSLLNQTPPHCGSTR